MMAKVKKDFDARKRTLRSLPVGTLVVIQDRKTRRWTRRAIIVEKKTNRNTYLVESSGKRLLRNRKFLRPCLNQDIDEEIKAEQPEESGLEPGHDEPKVRDQTSDQVERPLRGIKPEQAKQPILRRSKRHCTRKAKKVRFE